MEDASALPMRPRKNPYSGRVSRTKTALMDALRSLLSEKPLAEIGVTELCERAGVGRSTFYRHYSLPIDVLAEYVRDFFWSNVELVDGGAGGVAAVDERGIYRVMRSNCELIRRNGKALLSCTNDEIMQVIAATIPFDALLGGARGDDDEFPYVFVSGGVAAVLVRWALSGFEEPAESVAKRLAAQVARALPEPEEAGAPETGFEAEPV